MRRLSIILISVFVFALGTGVAFSNENKSKHNENSNDKVSQELSVKHPDNWVDEELHGEYVEEYGDSKCQECHGADLKGGKDAPSCKECHDKHEDND
ncbi:MAG: hypothetical protein Q7U10_09915 [Thermodesulfovibrionia bacterium]|nr:hypothetical protein [Thermodesulfovibrionia bacterium]